MGNFTDSGKEIEYDDEGILSIFNNIKKPISIVAIVLERAGFNNFTLVDFDVVEESNLIRQFPYNCSDVGKLKTEIMKEKLKNSLVKCKNLKIIKEDDIINEIKLADFVLCTVDKP